MTLLTPPNDTLRGLRILVVEDQFLLSELVVEMLSDAGAEHVATAANTKDAIPILEGPLPIDAAIIDINLGDQSGYQLAEKLLGGGIPFIFATGYGTSALPPQWRTIPLVSKPYSADMLVTTLYNTIAGQKSSR